MTQLKQIYKCNLCGNIIEVLHSGVGELICCGEPMELLKEKEKEAEGKEKHVPVVVEESGKTRVKIGSVSHPMEEDHYIEWIEIINSNKSYRKHLKPGESPEAVFETENKGIQVRAYCNIHGLWILAQ